MLRRRLLASRHETGKRLPGRRHVACRLLPLVFWLCLQALDPGSGGAKTLNLGPNEIQSRYRDILSMLAEGDRSGALEALYEFETSVVGEDQPWKRVEDFWRLKLRALRDVLDGDSLDLLMPVMMLHHDASQLYSENQRPFLSGHSRIMTTELAEIYADRANSGPAREFSGWVMTSLGAMVWHPSSVASSADLFYRAQMVDPGNPISLMGLGAAYERIANYEKAMEYLSRLLTLDPADSEAALHLAMCQLRGDVTLREQGLATLRTLQLEPAPDWIRSIAYQETARAQLGDPDLEKAEVTLREGLAALSGDPELSLQLAMVLDSRRRPKEALEILSTVTPQAAQEPSPRLVYDVWEPTGLEDVRQRLWNAAEAGLPVLAAKLGQAGPESGGG